MRLAERACARAFHASTIWMHADNYRLCGCLSGTRLGAAQLSLVPVATQRIRFLCDAMRSFHSFRTFNRFQLLSRYIDTHAVLNSHVFVHEAANPLLRVSASPFRNAKINYACGKTSRVAIVKCQLEKLCRSA